MRIELATWRTFGELTALLQFQFHSNDNVLVFKKDNGILLETRLEVKFDL